MASLAGAASSASAQETLERDGHGAGSDGLPAIERVVHARSGPAGRLTLAADLGYGYTEGVLDQGEAHHRGALGLGVGIAPLDWLGTGLELLGRYHLQSGGDDDGDDGFLMRTRLSVRAATRVGDGLSAGAELRLQLPAADSAGDALDGIGGALLALASWAPSRAWLLSAQMGVRIDRQGEAIGDPARLGGADRLALDTADSDAIPLGLGLEHRFGDVALFGEWSWEPRMGTGAQDALDAPMWITGGARVWLAQALEWRASLSGSPSGRPDVSDPAELSVVEPRLWFRTGIALHLGGRPRATAPTQHATAPVAPAAPPSAAPATLRGEIRRADGVPIEGAQVSVAPLPPGADASAGADANAAAGTSGDDSADAAASADASTDATADADAAAGTDTGAHTTQSDAAGRFELPALPPGRYRLSVAAEGYEPFTQEVELGAGAAPELPIPLERALPDGHIRGQVRNFRGRAVAAHVTIAPLGLELDTDAEGIFDVDVPPGEYQVTVSAPRYSTQERPAVVEQDGVTVLIFELRRGRR